VARSYSQYCPIAHALDLVGERWSLLVVRELQHGPLRYTDLHARLHGVSTNVLATRLRELEQGGVVRRSRLPAPAATTVYELTQLGAGLAPVLRELAHWGARSLGPPTGDAELHPGWLERALRTALGDGAPGGSVELRVGDEVACVVDGDVRPGPADDPDVVLRCDAVGVFNLLVEGVVGDDAAIEGDASALERLAAAASRRASTLGATA
jgi:DNA-binding HxlR family transcriptional regulator